MGQANTSPLEILAGPLSVYYAPVATAFPAVSEAPAAAWVLVGANGALNYDEQGVGAEHAQSFNFFRALGDAGSRKVFRKDEDLKINLILYDLTLESYRLAINSNTITTAAATTGTAGGGYKKIGLSRGLSVATMALLVRGASPYMTDGYGQFEIPICVQTGTPKPVYKRDMPAGLALEWTALVDPSASSAAEYFGRIKMQNAANL